MLILLKLQIINTVTDPGGGSSTLTLLWGFPSCPSVCACAGSWMRKWSRLGTVPVFVFVRVFSVWIISPFWFITHWYKWICMGRKDGTGAGINRQRVDLLFLAPVLASACWSDSQTSVIVLSVCWRECFLQPAEVLVLDTIKNFHCFMRCNYGP